MIFLRLAAEAEQQKPTNVLISRCANFKIHCSFQKSSANCTTGGRHVINRGWNPRAHQPKGLATPKWVELKYGNKWLKAIFISSRGNVPGLIGIVMNEP